MSQIQRPTSASNPIVVTIGFLTLLICFVGLKFFRLFESDVVGAVGLSISITGCTVFALDIFWQKVYLRPTTGLDFDTHNSSWNRTFIKLFGLMGSIWFIAVLYWLFPEYHGEFYSYYWKFLRMIAPFWILMAVPYFYFVDQKMVNPKDGYWHMGQVFLLNFEHIDGKILWQHLLGWLIKAFFLPLMLTYFCRDLDRFLHFNFDSIVDFKTFFDFTYDNIFLFDVGIVSIGYILSIKLFDTQIRSSEPTMLGWAVALVCYEPFWSTFGKNYIDYSSDYGWGAWLSENTTAYMFWGSCILILFGIYLWASIMFGCRFSNLTHRGILTNGPYRFSKHPAYVAKNLAWWMTSVPFLGHDGIGLAVKRCLLLLALNGIYFLRAKTEERHLSQDPTYIAYANWMNENGIFRKLNRSPFFAFIKYQTPLPPKK